MEKTSEPANIFHEWQRLAPMSLLFLIVGGSLKFIRENLYLFAGAGAGFAFMDRLGLREFLLLGVLALLIAILAAVIHYRRFRFKLEDDAILVRSGLFEVKDLRIRFARVQNVGLNQPFYFRPFGLVRFQLETPGAESTEVELPGVREEVALALRDRVAGWDSRSREIQSADDQGAPTSDLAAAGQRSGTLLHAPSAGRLFMHGLVSNQVWVIAGVIAWLFGTLEDRVVDFFEAAGITELFLARFSETGWLGLLILTAGALSLLFVLSGTIAWLRYQDFALRRHSDRIVSAGGLADKREQSMKLEKLTGLTVYQTALGRLLGQRYLVARQATSGALELDGSRAQFLIPGVSPRQDDLVSAVLPGAELPTELHPVSRRFVALYATRIGAVIVLAMAILWWRFPQVAGYWLIAPLLLVLMAALVYARWRCWGWQMSGGLVWVQRGLLGQRQDVFFIPMVQQVRIVQSPYLRRHDLATVRLTLPQGDHDIPMLPMTVAAELANRAIYAAETALEHRV